MTTPTETSRRQAAARFAGQLGLADGDALYRGAMAAWSSLNPQSVTFEAALSVAGVVLAAARPSGGQPAVFCPENPGKGKRSYILAADPMDGSARAVIETGPDGERQVFAIVGNGYALDALDAIRRAYTAGRHDYATDAIEDAADVDCRPDGQP